MRCPQCNMKFDQAKNYWLGAMHQQFSQGGVSADFEQSLYRAFQEIRMPPDLGQPIVQQVQYLRNITETNRLNQIKDHWLATIQREFDQGGVSVDLEQQVKQKLHEAKMPSDLGQRVIQRLQYLRNLSEIRWGNIPRIRIDMHLDSDEYAHFNMPTTYHKPNKNVKIVPGRLVGTNKKLYFLSNTGRDSATLNWDNISRVQERESYIHITVSKGAGGGSYSVNDPLYTKTIMDSLVRLWKRQLVIYQEQKTHGAIPEHIKAAVFHRDNGTCRQCGYKGEYIEYDHVIPRSKGGQNTVENIQLLCRKCNLRKGDRL